jgi:hypothetical protein
MYNASFIDVNVHATKTDNLLFLNNTLPFNENIWDKFRIIDTQQVREEGLFFVLYNSILL